MHMTIYVYKSCSSFRQPSWGKCVKQDNFALEKYKRYYIVYKRQYIHTTNNMLFVA